jgi:hypothetical protein
MEKAVTEEELTKSLIDGLERQVDFGQLYDAVRAFAQNGGERTIAEKVLRDLLLKMGTEYEDIILDLSDFVTGWCHPSRRIWPESG